jgi:hypothetical protein
MLQNYLERVQKMLAFKIPKSIILTIFRTCIIPKANHGAFIDQSSSTIKNMYNSIDSLLAQIFIDIISPIHIDLHKAPRDKQDLVKQLMAAMKENGGFSLLLPGRFFDLI